MTVPRNLTGLQVIDGTAVRAFGFAGAGHVQINLGVAAPDLHVRFRAGAKHAALGVEVFGQQFNGVLVHADTLVSQWAYLGLRPLTMSKNALWIFSVMGPREPEPNSMRSSSRMGVTSAAVPVKKASSQM